jgi:Uma2 family endonuclease
MGVAEQIAEISIAEYLAGEERSPFKHEYIGGVVYAMAGGTNTHNLIASNCLGLLHAALRGKRCRAFNSDTKIRVRLPGHTRFYYPDVSVVCQFNQPDDTFQDSPVVVVEVLSESTRRTDQLEKRDAYLTIPALSAYVMIDGARHEVVVLTRTENGIQSRRYTNLSDVIPLPDIDAELRLAEIYDVVAF